MAAADKLYPDVITRLQRCINDLTSVLSLPATWSGGDKPQIVSTLLAPLLGILDLDLAYVRLNGPADEAPIEILRVGRLSGLSHRPQSLTEILDRGVGANPQQWSRIARTSLEGG